jgi:hypothetical protein
MVLQRSFSPAESRGALVDRPRISSFIAGELFCAVWYIRGSKHKLKWFG